VRIAVAQFDPTADPSENAATLTGLAVQAADGGARLMVAPEGSIVDFLTEPAVTRTVAEPLDGPFVSGLLAASQQYGIAVAAGTFTPDRRSGRVHNTLVVADRGELRAAYHKVHLYDAFSFTESDTVAPGDAAPPVLDFDGVAVGFATCYDLRFPELFRVLGDSGADVMALASAWVVGPGKEEHWLTLLRARAIENTSYLVAADQAGRRAIGRSAAFDPFGLPLLDMGTAAPSLGFVDISGERLAEVRALLPSSRHGRFRVAPSPS
jgi:predicted amidohydrolase